MRTFTEFLLARLPLAEASIYFPRQFFNDVFRKDIERILSTEILDKQVVDDLTRVKDLDLVGYVDSSLRRSGFKDWELDEILSDMLVRLLVDPGSLMKKWDRKSPMSARLKVAVRNSIITLAKKKQRRARRFQELPDAVEAKGCESDSSLIDQFREELRKRLGEAAVRVFDTRLADEDIKRLVGSSGIPSSYRLKTIVQGIKEIARGFGDECLQGMVAKMSVQESDTLARRFRRSLEAPVGG